MTMASNDDEMDSLSVDETQFPDEDDSPTESLNTFARTGGSSNDERNTSAETRNYSNGTTTTQQAATTMSPGTNLYSIGLAMTCALEEKLFALGLQLEQFKLTGLNTDTVVEKIRSLKYEDGLKAYEEAVKPLISILYYAAQQNSRNPSNEPPEELQRPNETIAVADQMEVATAMQWYQPALLPKLVEKPKFVIGENNPIELSISGQPQTFWHGRYLKCLLGEKCSALTGRSNENNQNILLQWSDICLYDPKTLFFSVEILTYDNKIHPTKNIVPPDIKVNQNQNDAEQERPLTLDDLIIGEKYRFDREAKRLVYPLEPDENHRDQMNVKVLVFSSKTNENVKLRQNDQQNIKVLSRKIFKLRFQLFQWTGTMLKSISNFVDTDPIEESKQTKELEIIGWKAVPDNLSSFELEFNTNTDKYGFQIFVNDRKLKLENFSGVNKKKMTIRAEEFQQNFRLRVYKKSLMKTIAQGLDRDGNLQSVLLLDLPFLALFS